MKCDPFRMLTTLVHMFPHIELYRKVKISTLSQHDAVLSVYKEFIARAQH